MHVSPCGTRKPHPAPAGNQVDFQANALAQLASKPGGTYSQKMLDRLSPFPSRAKDRGLGGAKVAPFEDVNRRPSQWTERRRKDL